MAQVIGAMRARKGAIRIAVIGLGSGSLACYIEPGDQWRFFEIDPSIVAIARDRPFFTFVRACAPTCRSSWATRGSRSLASPTITTT